MTWLFSKAMMEAYGNSLCLPEQEAEYSGESCSDGEPYAQLNVMPTPHKFWRNDKTMEFSSLSRFGLTYKLLTEQDGEGLLMSYLAAFPVKDIRQSGIYTEATVSMAGHTKNGSSVKLCQNSVSWKMYQLSLNLEDGERLLSIYPHWGMTRNGEFFAVETPRKMPQQLGEGYLQWRRPAATDWKRRNMDWASVKKPGNPLCLPQQIAQSGKGGYLNPQFPAWLMGWPLTWAATAFTLLAQRAGII